MGATKLENPVPWARSRPERFFRSGTPNALELAQSVWADATLSGAADVLVHHDDEQWVIAASTNWLIDTNVSPSDLFVRVVPLAAAGPNSMRSELLLNAFC